MIYDNFIISLVYGGFVRFSSAKIELNLLHRQSLQVSRILVPSSLLRTTFLNSATWNRYENANSSRFSVCWIILLRGRIIIGYTSSSQCHSCDFSTFEESKMRYCSCHTIL